MLPAGSFHGAVRTAFLMSDHSRLIRHLLVQMERIASYNSGLQAGDEML